MPPGRTSARAGLLMAAPTLTQRIAVHESGHAIVARLLSLPGCGGAFLAPPHAIFPTNHGAASICALMGGAIAEVLHFGDYDRVGITIDWKRASRRLRRLGYTDNGQALWTYTFGLLHPYAGLVKLVAAKLERARMLDGATVDALVFRG